MENQNYVVLAVDDTADNLDLLEYGLRRRQITVLRATSGKECLAIAAAELPDVILLDVQMPDMDGYETLRQLRASKATASIPVMFLTAEKRDPASIEQGLTLGAEMYLTKPIDVEELLVRTKMLIRATRAEAQLQKIREEFMAMLVHDLRSPIVSIRMTMRYLLDEAEAMLTLGKYAELMTSSYDAAERMLNLINDLLDLSKYEAGTMVLDRMPVNLPDLFRKILKELELQFNQRGIALHVFFEENAPDVFGDMQKLEQVAINILSNALKFSREGGSIAVEIRRAFRPGSAGETLLVRIADTGLGIAKDDLPFIFEKYRQGSASRQARQKGTGLGLAICKLIVEAHGGVITAESVSGKGTTITFELPALPVRESKSQTQDVTRHDR